MNWEEYLELSEKTLSNGFHIDVKLEKVLHAVIGIGTEIEELLDNYKDDYSMDETNLLEEIGDILWYLAILHREYPDMKRYNNTNVINKCDSPFECVLNINKTTLKLLDILKKKIYYNKTITQIVFDNLTLLIESDINWLIEHYNLKIEDVCKVNIDKLKARYGDKFTSERAINRNLATERNILEGK